jgi:hypothetical protein
MFSACSLILNVSLTWVVAVFGILRAPLCTIVQDIMFFVKFLFQPLNSGIRRRRKTFLFFYVGEGYKDIFFAADGRGTT